MAKNAKVYSRRNHLNSSYILNNLICSLKLFQKDTPNLDDFIAEFFETFEEEIILIIHKSVRKLKK